MKRRIIFRAPKRACTIQRNTILLLLLAVWVDGLNGGWKIYLIIDRCLINRTLQGMTDSCWDSIKHSLSDSRLRSFIGLDILINWFFFLIKLELCMSFFILWLNILWLILDIKLDYFPLLNSFCRALFLWKSLWIIIDWWRLEIREILHLHYCRWNVLFRG